MKYVKCPKCGKKSDIRIARISPDKDIYHCTSCGYEFSTSRGFTGNLPAGGALEEENSPNRTEKEKTLKKKQSFYTYILPVLFMTVYAVINFASMPEKDLNQILSKINISEIRKILTPGKTKNAINPEKCGENAIFSVSLEKPFKDIQKQFRSCGKRFKIDKKYITIIMRGPRIKYINFSRTQKTESLRDALIFLKKNVNGMTLISDIFTRAGVKYQSNEERLFWDNPPGILRVSGYKNVISISVLKTRDFDSKAQKDMTFRSFSLWWHFIGNYMTDRQTRLSEAEKSAMIGD